MSRSIPYGLILFIIIMHSFIINTFPIPKLEISRQQISLNIKQAPLRLFHLGHSYTIGDFLWLDTMLFSDLEHVSSHDIQSWMFIRFWSIVHLDPQFYKAYQLGGLYLSVIKDDILGAEKLYLKGLEQFPDDFQLNFQLGQLYLLEFEDYKMAYKYLYKIRDDKKAPFYIHGLLGRISANMKDFTLAYKLTYDNYLKYKDDPGLSKRYLDILYALRAENDLECLNSSKEKCNKNDLFNKPYLLEIVGTQKIFKAQRAWQKIRMYKKKK